MPFQPDSFDLTSFKACSDRAKRWMQQNPSPDWPPKNTWIQSMMAAAWGYQSYHEAKKRLEGTKERRSLVQQAPEERSSPVTLLDEFSALNFGLNPSEDNVRRFLQQPSMRGAQTIELIYTNVECEAVPLPSKNPGRLDNVLYGNAERGVKDIRDHEKKGWKRLPILDVFQHMYETLFHPFPLINFSVLPDPIQIPVIRSCNEVMDLMDAPMEMIFLRFAKIWDCLGVNFFEELRALNLNDLMIEDVEGLNDPEKIKKRALSLGKLSGEHLLNKIERHFVDIGYVPESDPIKTLLSQMSEKSCWFFDNIFHETEYPIFQDPKIRNSFLLNYEGCFQWLIVYYHRNIAMMQEPKTGNLRFYMGSTASQQPPFRFISLLLAARMHEHPQVLIDRNPFPTSNFEQPDPMKKMALLAFSVGCN